MACCNQNNHAERITLRSFVAFMIGWTGVLFAVGIWLFTYLSVEQTHATMANASTALAASKGSCIADYKTWEKMPEGPQKASKLVFFKTAYGTLNFHDNCVGNPRPVTATEAI